MRAIFVLYALVFCVAWVNAASGPTPVTVPVFGINSPPQPPYNTLHTLSTTQNCQLITGVQSVTEFGFWMEVTNGKPNDFALVGQIGILDPVGSNLVYGSKKQAITSTSMVYSEVACCDDFKDAGGESSEEFCETDSNRNCTPLSWQYYYVNADASGLDYLATYAICLFFDSSCLDADQPVSDGTSYNWAQLSTGDGSFARVTGATAVSTTYNNLLFTVVTDNFQELPNLNYVDHITPPWSAAPNCIYRTTYTAVVFDVVSSVIWTNHREYTSEAFSPNAWSTYSCASPSTVSPAVYGQPSSCSNTASWALLDIRGTGWQFSESWSWGLGSWGVTWTYSSFSSNDQVVNLAVQAWCGFLSSATGNGGVGGIIGNQGDALTGGPFIGIAPVVVC